MNCCVRYQGCLFGPWVVGSFGHAAPFAFCCGESLLSGHRSRRSPHRYIFDIQSVDVSIESTKKCLMMVTEELSVGRADLTRPAGIALQHYSISARVVVVNKTSQRPTAYFAKCSVIVHGRWKIEASDDRMEPPSNEWWEARTLRILDSRWSWHTTEMTPRLGGFSKLLHGR